MSLSFLCLSIFNCILSFLPNLDEQLKTRGIKTLVLADIATSFVVLSTVRESTDKDYGIIVSKNLCFDSDPQNYEVLTEKLFLRQAWVMTSEEFTAKYLA